MLKTENYQLNKPEPNDPLRVADFNENADIIDGLLNTLSTAVPRIVTGTYTGNRAASKTISVGFTPKAVYVCAESGLTYQSSGGYIYLWGGLALVNHPIVVNKGVALEIVEGGFKVAFDESSYGTTVLVTNGSGSKYYYVAVDY